MFSNGDFIIYGRVEERVILRLRRLKISNDSLGRVQCILASFDVIKKQLGHHERKSVN